jgi:hypothetical protein
LRKPGFDVDLYSLLQENDPLCNPEAEKILPDVFFCPLWHLRSWYLAGRTFVRAPLVTVRAIVALLYYNRNNLRYLEGAMVGTSIALAFAALVRQSGVTHVYAHFVSAVATWNPLRGYQIDSWNPRSGTTEARPNALSSSIATLADKQTKS